MLELIKELCKPKDGVGSIPPSPAVYHIVNIALPETSGLAHQAWKRKECQFKACRNKSSPSIKTFRINTLYCVKVKL